MEFTLGRNDRLLETPIRISAEQISPHSFRMQTPTAQAITVRNKWTGNILVNDTVVSPSSTIIINALANDIIEVAEESDGVFREFETSSNAFVTSADHNIVVLSMPAMDRFTTDVAGTIAGDYFFAGFFGTVNNSIISLPAGSFDTSNLVTAGPYFFRGFVANSDIQILPEGSFNLGNLETAGLQYFMTFANGASLSSLPEGSFNAPKLNTTVSANQFMYRFALSSSLQKDNTGNGVKIRNANSSACTFNWGSDTDGGGAGSVSVPSGDTFDGYVKTIY